MVAGYTKFISDYKFKMTDQKKKKNFRYVHFENEH